MVPPVVVLSIVWVVCGVLAAGLLNADLRYRPDPRRTLHNARADWGFAMAIGLFGGPIAFVFASIITGFGASGWSLKRTLD